MKNQNHTSVSYTVAVTIEKSVSEVFNHLIDLSRWWPEDFVGENIKPDSEFVLKTGEGHFSKNKIVEFTANEKLVWLTTESMRNSDNFDWTGTKFIFELTSEGSDTLLKFIYDGVVLGNERERLTQICDMCIKKMFYNFVINGKTK